MATTSKPFKALELKDFEIPERTTPNKLEPAEEQLLEAVRAWSKCDVSPSLPGERTESNIIRAHFIRFLTLEGDNRSFVHEKGVQLSGAYIEGDLDFHGCEIKRPLFLTQCRFSDALILQDAKVCTIRLDGSHLNCIDAQRAKINGSLYMHGCTAAGEVRLIDADIAGSLECHGARFSRAADKPIALYASRVKVGGSVFLHQDFCVESEVSFRGAVIRGNMECTSGTFSNPNGAALSCKGVVIDGNVSLDRGFSAHGEVDFTGATIRGNFTCDGGRFEKSASTGPLRRELSGAALAVKRARIDGSVYLRKITDGTAPPDACDFTAKGEVNFVDAKVGGSFGCHGGHFMNEDGVALWCSRITVSGGVFLHRHFKAEGEVAFRSARIGGNLDASTARFNSERPATPENRDQRSLSCERMRIRGSVILKNSVVTNQIDLIDADIGGSLECHSAHFNNTFGITLHCSRTKIGGSAFLHDGFVSSGKIVFRSAEIGGNLKVSDASLSCEGVPEMEGRELKSLCCERIRVTGSVFLNRTRAKNQIDFIDAHIDGSLECHGARLGTTGKIALYCSRASIGGSVFMYEKFEASGTVVFRQAAVGGNFECDTGKFDGAGRTALNCEGMKVPGNVWMGNGFEALGEVQFVNAEIGGHLGCAGGSFNNIRPRREISEGQSPSADTAAADGPEHDICADALKLRGAVIKGNLWLGPANTPPHDRPVSITGSLDLRDAQAGVLIDDMESWPPDTVPFGTGTLKCHIYLDGFTYNRIGGRASLDLKMRKKWLLRQPEDDLVKHFKGQAFEQLVRVLRDMGHTDGARAIAIFKERLRIWRPLDGWFLRGWRWWLSPLRWFRLFAFDGIAGYGYRAHRVVIAAIFIWLGCAIVYLWADGEGLVQPVNCQMAKENAVVSPGAAAGNGAAAACNPQSAKFNALKFSADVMLPVVNLQEKTLWKFKANDVSSLPELLDFLKSAENLFGWIAGIILAALLGRKINRE